MNIEEIKNNAPDGATHAVSEHGNIDYLKHECGNWWVWQNKDWVRLHPIVVKSYHDIIKPL